MTLGSLLVAHHGGTAMRITTTARAFGLCTVAVHSDAAVLGDRGEARGAAAVRRGDVRPGRSATGVRPLPALEATTMETAVHAPRPGEEPR
ncbi:hypothetical protein [Streptomyces mayteni]